MVGQAMSPKVSPKHKKEVVALSAPVVSASDVARAKEALQDEKQRKREHSNMLFWLKKEGNKEAYEASPMHAKKEFLISWFADKLCKGDVKSSSSKDIGSTKQSGHEYSWVSKHHLVRTLGKEKAELQIASGKMLTRPDRVTGLSCEWSLEYKLFTDVGSEMEHEDHHHKLETEKALKSDVEKAEAMEDWFAARLREKGETGSNSRPVSVKIEPSEEESKKDKEKTEAQKKLNKTIETLTSDPRKILKVISATVITLKVMFQSTTECKYTEKLNEDIGKLLPRFKTNFKGVESLALKSSHDLEKFAGSDDGQAVIRAVAVKLEANFEKYNELCDWHTKFVPNNGNGKRQRVK